MEERIEPATLGSGLLAEAEGMADELVAWRREFHQFPELAFEENITASRVAQTLAGFPGIEVISGFGVATSVLGLLRGDLPGKALVLRADMDALALEEETNLPFASCIPGVMHACGHDAHMAALLGAAALLSRRAEQLSRPVIFLFQPAEEGRGGARALVEAGLFSRFPIGRVLGVHLWPNQPYGSLRTRKGILTALSDRIHIEIQGVGGHAAAPHTTVDPITIAAHLILTIQTLLAREVDPAESAVISFGQLESGYAYNIIPETAHLWGTLRAFESRVRDFVQERLETVVPSVARAWRALATLEYHRNYPQVRNDPETVERVLEVAARFLGPEAVSLMERPILSGEDFAFYSLEVPSCFLLLGTGLEYGLHHSRYDVPEDLLPLTAAFEAYLGLSY